MKNTCKTLLRYYLEKYDDMNSLEKLINNAIVTDYGYHMLVMPTREVPA
ncbi:hypothetical protein [Desulfonema magnum]|uniref:Uncharacterized protein n=1 Tax=Desulfonema magnum TaxID=45655 RepID=A0A975BXY3_9BACT|nr:hypothetical protein [Desulfonema magnum]QTA93557.1 Uncharacterized protein dnm_096590 [Desulfonema magnum]